MFSLADRFNQKVRADWPASGATLADLAETIRRDGVSKVIDDCDVFLRPGFLTASERAELERDLSGLFDLMCAVPERLFGGDVSAMCDAVGIGGVEKAAVLATWTDRDVLLGRADLFRDTTGFKLLEFNVHSSTGGLENADLNRAMMDVPFFHAFVQEEGLTFTDTVDGVANALWTAARKRGLGERPTVAVVDWHTTYPTFERSLQRIAELLTNRGFEAFACHVRQMTVRDGVLYVGERPVNILYRIFLADDLHESPADLNPILEAHRAGTLLLGMSFVAELIGNKGIIALLSDPANRERFSSAEQAIIDRRIPWTRFLRAGHTSWNGQPVDLIPFVLAKQSELVLKPTMGYAGHGVCTGWSVTAAEWRSVVEQVIHEQAPYVVQERVHPSVEAMPMLTPDGLQFQNYVLNWGVFVAGGRYNGAMIRGAPAETYAVVNLRQGGFSGCCFHKAI